MIRTGLKVKKESSLQGFGGMEFEVEGVASAKALRALGVCGWREEKAEWKEMWLVRQWGHSTQGPMDTGRSLDYTASAKGGHVRVSQGVGKFVV